MSLLQVSNRILIGKALRAPLRFIPGRLDLPVLSGPLIGFRWRVGSSTHGCWLGSYEQEKAKRLAEACRPGMVAYDIGANAGYYSLLMSRYIGSKGHVYAFEPFPENVTNLLHHISVNRVKNCTVIEAAVSESSRLAGFAPAASNSMGSLAQGEAPFRVGTVSIDDLVDRHEIPLPDIVKIDVEGAESAVLAGAHKTLGLSRACWFIALHGDAPAARCREQLRRGGYRVHLLNGTLLEPTTNLAGLEEIYAER